MLSLTHDFKNCHVPHRFNELILKWSILQHKLLSDYTQQIDDELDSGMIDLQFDHYLQHPYGRYCFKLPKQNHSHETTKTRQLTPYILSPSPIGTFV